MRDSRQLPFLIKLLEDESPSVRESVYEQLIAFGPSLETELLRVDLRLTSRELDGVRAWIRERSREWLRQSWASWSEDPEPYRQLESALNLVAEFQEDRYRPGKTHALLDELAEEYRSTYGTPSTRDLSSFLFRVKNLQGAREDYYNPLNSSLVYAIEKRRGIPISLVLIYMLVGRRLGLTIEGCNFPGHFLALARESDATLVIDCYNGGLVIDNAILSRYFDPVTVTVEDLLRLRANTPTTISRVLRNLVNAYRATAQSKDLELIEELLGTLSGASLN
jgi:regulator of sirC expression with transglutaminase-like and TPR domain